jgi:Domain of Unknown Function with PDB structure (DUF3857)
MPAWNSSLSTGFSLCPFICILLTTLISAPLSPSQTPANKPAPNSEEEKNPAQIELLETKYRFETNGDSRKEVHTRVRINNELGVRQFARLNFDFNRSFQAVEIPLVHITHPSGGSADILPSAITDNPNPAVVDYPAYQDVRVKSVRILGLQPDDLLEYRVITTTSHHALAPDFWLDHTFDRSGVVSQEIFDLNMPALQKLSIKIDPRHPAASIEKASEGQIPRVNYHWELPSSATNKHDETTEVIAPDLVITTFTTWNALSEKIDTEMQPPADDASQIGTKARELTANSKGYEASLVAIYDFVSTKIATVDLPLGSTLFKTRPPTEILSSKVATAEDKFALFAALAHAAGMPAVALLAGASADTENRPPTPTPFTHLIVGSFAIERSFWLDPSVEVAPFGLIPSNLQGQKALQIKNWTKLASAAPLGKLIQYHAWQKLEQSLPFTSSQNVSVAAALGSTGDLSARVRYILRGDNELLLRVAFHKTPKEKWKDVAQMLALSDGFRGQITNVTASDPYATKEPFTVEYEISQPKSVDWSTKTVRIPAILPLPGLPDPATPVQIEAKKPIELGTPLAIDLEATIELPAGTIAQAPTGTTVNRDYATFSSNYSAQGNTLRATRKLHFISREIPATRASDLNAFLHAVQADQTQLFTLQRSDATAK